VSLYKPEAVSVCRMAAILMKGCPKLNKVGCVFLEGRERECFESIIFFSQF